MKVGIVGLGLSAKHFHLPLLKLSGIKITSVCSSKTQFEVEQIIGSKVSLYKDIIAFSSALEYDIAIVLTPNHLHFSQAQTLLNYGKHVVVDKPVAIDSGEFEQLRKLAIKNKLILTAFHNRRWDGDFLTVKRLVEQNANGALRYFESRFDKYRPHVFGRWREQPLDGSGLLFDIGSHLIDQALLLFGTPLYVSACIEVQRKSAKVCDYFCISLKYESKNVVLRSSSLAAITPFRFYIEGEQGVFYNSGYDQQEAELSGLADADSTKQQEKMGTLFRQDNKVPIVISQGDYLAFYNNLKQVYKDRKIELLVSHEELAQVIKVIELSQLSADNNNCYIAWDSV